MTRNTLLAPPVDPPDENSSALARLRREWLITAELYGVALVLMFLLLRTQWVTATALRWGLLALVVQAEVLRVLWRNLDQHHRRGETRLLPSLGMGTALTLFRGGLIGLLAGFLLTPWPTGLPAWLPALFFTLAAITDVLDGYLARVTGQDTPLGEVLDMELDGLGMLVVVGVAIHFGQLPIWFVVIGLARYVFLLGVAIRQRLGKPIYEMTPSRTRRLLASQMMAYMSVVLWPIAPRTLAIVAGIVLGVPFLAGFLRDWLVVSGVVDPHSPRYRAFLRRAGRILMRQAPVAIRLLAAASAVVLAGRLTFDFPTAVAGYRAFGFPFPTLMTVVFIGLSLACAFALALGAAGRFFAMLLIALAVFTFAAQGGPLPETVTAVGASVYLLIFGTGAYSLWRLGDRFFYQRAGDARIPAPPSRPDEAVS